MLGGAEEQVASTPVDGMNKYLEETKVGLANMDTLYARSQPTNMLEGRTDRPRHGVQHISLFQPCSRQAGTQGDYKGQWLLQDTQEAIGAAQRPQSVQATQRHSVATYSREI